MKTDDLLKELERFKVALDANPGSVSFRWEQAKPWEGCFKDWFRREVPAEGASNKSGVYFIADEDCNVLYIGTYIPQFRQGGLRNFRFF